MQVIPIVAGILLLGLVTVSGFQLVPESALGSGSGNLSAGVAIADFDGPSTQPEVSKQVSVDFNPVVTAVAIKRPYNIESTTATLRARVVVGPEDLGAVFFVYSYNQSRVQQSTSRATSYTEVLEARHPTVQVKRVARSVGRTGDVSARVGGLATDATYYAQACVEVGTAVRCSDLERFNTIPGAFSLGEFDSPTVRIRNEELISATEIKLELAVDMRDSETGRVHVVYGTSEQRVEAAHDTEYGDIREAGDRLQKQRIITNAAGKLSLSTELADLEEETEYFYIVCASYQGLRDGTVCSRVRSIATPNETFGEAPVVRTFPPQVDWRQVTLRGDVRMRSFIDGRVFFVYGTDTSRIARLDGDNAMTDIRQSGDRLQRILVDADLDGSDTYKRTVTDLQFNTTYVARLCVEYENQNERYREVPFVACGAVQEFTTF